MLKNHISALPVVDAKGALAGILTKGDFFRAFVSISGIYQGPLAMGFELEEQPGAIRNVTDVIRSHNGRIASIMTGYKGTPAGCRQVYIRSKKSHYEKALQKELEIKHRVLYLIHEEVA
jgi:acetoin utilization protein AcuB